MTEGPKPPPILAPAPGAGSVSPGSAEVPAPQTPRFRWWIHLLLLAAYPVAIGLLGVERAENAPPALGSGVRALLVVTTVELGLFGVVFALAWVASRATREQMFLSGFRPLTQVPMGLGYSVALRLGVGLTVVFAAALLIATGVTTQAELQEFMIANRPDVAAVVDISALKENPVYFALAVTVVSFVVGGLREELWRGGLMGAFAVLWPARFGSRWGQLLAAAMAAVVFGLGHATQGWLGVVMTALLGLGLGALVALHRSIWPAVWAHGFFNATSLALLPWLADKLPGF